VDVHPVALSQHIGPAALVRIESRAAGTSQVIPEGAGPVKSL